MTEENILSRRVLHQPDELVDLGEVSLHVHAAELRDVELEVFALARVEVRIDAAGL